MRLNHSNNKDKRKDAKKMKRVILFVSVILVLILVSGFAAHKFSLNVKQSKLLIRHKIKILKKILKIKRKLIAL